jgi:MFS family permease
METAAENLVVFCIGRTFVGAGIGLIFAIVPVYIAEIAPARLRGSMVAITPFSTAVGAVTAFTVNYLRSGMNGDISWRIPFAV